MVLILTSPRDVKGGVEKRLGAYHLTALALNKTKFAPMITSNLCLHFFGSLSIPRVSGIIKA